MPDSTCSGAWFAICVDGDLEQEIARTNTFAVNVTKKAVTIDELPVAFPDREGSAEIRATAYVFAAASDLLRACEAALPHHQGGHSKVGMLLRAAISKAQPVSTAGSSQGVSVPPLGKSVSPALPAAQEEEGRGTESNSPKSEIFNLKSAIP